MRMVGCKQELPCMGRPTGLISTSLYFLRSYEYLLHIIPLGRCQPVAFTARERDTPVIFLPWRSIFPKSRQDTRHEKAGRGCSEDMTCEGKVWLAETRHWRAHYHHLDSKLHVYQHIICWGEWNKRELQEWHIFIHLMDVVTSGILSIFIICSLYVCRIDVTTLILLNRFKYI